jgi:hypothetical protein
MADQSHAAADLAPHAQVQCLITMKTTEACAMVAHMILTLSLLLHQSKIIRLSFLQVASANL